MTALDNPSAAAPHIVLVLCQFAFAFMQGAIPPKYHFNHASGNPKMLYEVNCGALICVKVNSFPVALFLKLRSFFILAVSSKVALDYIPPFPFAAVRVAVALPLLWGFATAVESGSIPRSIWHWSALAGLGVVGVFLPQSLIFVGVHMVGPDVVAIMQPTIPVLVMLLTSALGYERLTWLKTLGIGSSVSGAVVMLNIANLPLHSSKTMGVFVMFLQVLSYAVFITALSRYLKYVPHPFTVFFWVTVFGWLCLLACSINQFHQVLWGSVPGYAWAALIYAAVGVSFLAHGAVSWAVRHVPATIPSLYTCVQPLAATALSAIMYGDMLKAHHLWGMVLILCGLFVTVLAQQAEVPGESLPPSSPRDGPCLSDKPHNYVVQMSDEPPEVFSRSSTAAARGTGNDTQPLME